MSARAVRARWIAAARRVGSAVLSAALTGVQRVPCGLLPAGPLVALVGRYGGPRLAAAAVGRGSSTALERAYQRAAASGWLSWEAGDELSVRLLGLHPASVWGEAWWETAPAA